MTIRKEKEYFIIMMEINMKENLKMIILMEKENIHIPIRIYMKENFSMILFMEKVHFILMMEKNM